VPTQSYAWGQDYLDRPDSLGPTRRIRVGPTHIIFATSDLCWKSCVPTRCRHVSGSRLGGLCITCRRLAEVGGFLLARRRRANNPCTHFVVFQKDTVQKRSISGRLGFERNPLSGERGISVSAGFPPFCRCRAFPRRMGAGHREKMRRAATGIMWKTLVAPLQPKTPAPRQQWELDGMSNIQEHASFSASGPAGLVIIIRSSSTVRRSSVATGSSRPRRAPHYWSTARKEERFSVERL